MTNEFKYGIILTICITMATFEASLMMFDYIQLKKYIPALLILVIAAAFSWEIAIFMAILVGFKMLRKREKK